MERAILDFFKLIKSNSFKEFVNEFSFELYKTLSDGYAKNKNEVKLVTDLTNTIDGKKFDKLHFCSHKIHGTRSYVKFNYRDKSVTKELADMVIVSIIAKGRKKLLQKISFVQNKKDTNNSWHIDQEQLFLLKNFPTFSGQKGFFTKFNGKNNLVFNNNSGTLGTFGLFSNPGEMILASAGVIDSLQTNNKVNLNSFNGINIANNQSSLFNNTNMFLNPYLEEIFYVLHKYSGKYAHCGMFDYGLPFLNNSIFSKDIYDFIKNWSLFNIGETSYSFGQVQDYNLENFSNFLLHSIGYNDFIDLKNSNENYKFESDIAISVVKYDIND